MLVKEAAPLKARKTLQEHWDGEFPVNPVRIAESLGISVKFVDLKPNISGAILARSRDNIEILIDRYNSYERQMFSIAHELGHYAERSEKHDESYSFVERRGQKYDIHELYANEYAAELLMPEDKFREIFKQTNSLKLTADFFEVSMAAANLRKVRLGIE